MSNFSFKDYIFNKLLPRYFKDKDTYKDQNNKGILERFMEVCSEYLDTDIMADTEVDDPVLLTNQPGLDNITKLIDPDVTPELFLNYLWEFLGEIPYGYGLLINGTEYNPKDYSAWLSKKPFPVADSRRLLKYAISLYKIRGTEKFYNILGKFYGVDIYLREVMNGGNFGDPDSLDSDDHLVLATYPLEVKQVRYIQESSGQEMINTKYVPQPGDIITCQFSCDYGAAYSAIFGNRVDGNHNSTRLTMGSNNTVFYANINHINSSSKVIGVPTGGPDVIHTAIFYISQHIASIDGVSSSGSITTGADNNTPIALFKQDIEAGPATNYNKKIYSFNVTRNGETILDLVPAEVNGIGCLYDTVSKSIFYTTAGALICGPDMGWDIHERVIATYAGAIDRIRAAYPDGDCYSCLYYELGVNIPDSSYWFNRLLGGYGPVKSLDIIQQIVEKYLPVNCKIAQYDDGTPKRFIQTTAYEYDDGSGNIVLLDALCLDRRDLIYYGEGGAEFELTNGFYDLFYLSSSNTLYWSVDYLGYEALQSPVLSEELIYLDKYEDIDAENAGVLVPISLTTDEYGNQVSEAQKLELIFKLLDQEIPYSGKIRVFFYEATSPNELTQPDEVKVLGNLNSGEIVITPDTTRFKWAAVFISIDSSEQPVEIYDLRVIKRYYK